HFLYSDLDVQLHSSLACSHARASISAYFSQPALLLASQTKNFHMSVRSPRVRTITFLSCVCYIYLDASVQYGTSICLAISSSNLGLICSFCPSDREFA